MFLRLFLTLQLLLSSQAGWQQRCTLVKQNGVVRQVCRIK